MNTETVPWRSIPFSDHHAIEQFKTLDSLSINHGFSLNQRLPNLSIRPKYGVLNNRGEPRFYVFEESDSFQRVCCTNEREFQIHIIDTDSREVIRLHRPFQSCSGCCCCGSCESCMQQVTVQSPPGQYIGTVQQEGSTRGMHYVIKDASERPMLTIAGPCCICNGAYSCGCENKYTLLGTDRETEIGSIDKKYPESMSVFSANPVAFTLNFPLNLDSKMKILSLAALFLIDIGNYKMIRLRS